MQIRKMRLLRLKHNISCASIGKAAGLSRQRISEIELGDTSVEHTTIEKIQTAFYSIISERTDKLNELIDDFMVHEDDLMSLVEENGYEL